MRLFSEFRAECLGEDAGDKFRAMSDDQFAGWKKANPGAASKADQLRNGNKTTTPKSIGGDPASKGSAIVKAKQAQKQRQAKEKQQLVKQQAQDKAAEAKKDREEKSALAKDQQQRKQDLTDKAREAKSQATKDAPGKGVVSQMKAKSKSKAKGPGLGSKLNNLGAKALKTQYQISKGAWNLAKGAVGAAVRSSNEADRAPGIGSAPGDLAGLPQRFSGI